MMERLSSVVAARADGAREGERVAWESFVSAKSSDEFCRAWLALVCARIPQVRAAAILVESAQAHTFVPMAVWPSASPDMARLAGVVERALRERAGVVQPESAEQPGVTQMAYPVLVDNRVAGVVALDVASGQEQVGALLREVHWGSAWLASMFGRRELDQAIEAKERVGAVLETVAVALRHGKFTQALFEVANELRRRFDCSRVAIGLVENVAVKLVAISEAATFEKHTPLATAYVQAMEEAHDFGKPLSEYLPADGDDAAASAHVRHRELLAVSGATAVLSVPLIQNAQCLGVITLERAGENGFDAAALAWLEAFAALAAPIVEQRLAAERGVLSRLTFDAKSVLEKLFGPRHLVWKAAASALALVTVLLVLIPIEYRVTAKTVIEGEVQRVAAAPFEGFIGAAYVRAGDTVKAGQPLAQLDDRELRIEEAKWSSERDQYDNRLREAMANHDLTSVQVVGAQLRQSEAQLKLVSEKIARAQLTAPFDGIVVSGDLSQQIGAPVEVGKKLFEIAPLQSYRVILQVDEREIRHVRAGQVGQLVITGIATDPMPVTVAKVTPVAAAQDGKNVFRVEAALEQGDARLRPGMEGVAKVEVGSQRLWWVLTHSFTDWLRLTLWTWLP